MKSKLKLYLRLVGLFTILLSCSKDKVPNNAYDPNYQDLVEYDSKFIGEWKTANGGEEFYLHFDIPVSGPSHFVSDNKDNGLPPTDIIKKAKYNEDLIFLEEMKIITINQYPTIQNDTVEQYNVNGSVKYVYSAIMMIDGIKLYRVEEIIQ